jgi:hypothetical protein
MAEVRVIMMQRDEGDTLARWIAHYGGLFGLPNLSIMDNGSTDPFTLALLREAELGGAKIYWGFDTPHDFHNKGGHFGNIVIHWDAEYAYDFALPVDCDEILAVFTDEGLSTEHEAIHAEFDRLLGMKTSLRIDMSLFNVPERPGWFAPVRHFHKGFLASRTIEIIDNGHHEPISRAAPGFETTRFTYLHNHNSAYAAWRKKLRRKFPAGVDPDDPEAIRAYEAQPRAEGAHLMRAWTMSRKAYLGQYDADLLIHHGDGGTFTMLQRPQDGLHVWDNDAYRDANPDVRGYALTALHHYVRYGFLEGRPLTL